MRRVEEATAPLTTIPMISTDITSPSTPKAMTNGAKVAAVRSAPSLMVRYDAVPVRPPAGTAAAIVARSEAISSSVPACRNR